MTSQHPHEAIQQLLEQVRAQLGLDLCFVGEITGNRRIFRFIDGERDSFGVEVGLVEPADATYCQRMLEGILPAVVPDARADARTAALPVTAERAIGSFISFPIVLASGRVYGTLCALGHEVRRDLDERDVGTMRLIAGMIAEQLSRGIEESEERETSIERIRAVLEEPGRIQIAYQPIVHLPSGMPVGAEALARFDDGRGPDEWFTEAWRAGLGVELELHAAARAVEGLDRLPHDLYLALNASPETVMSNDFGSVDFPVDWTRLVVEITEHASIESYERMQDALAGVLRRGARLAIDDAGAGFASLVHITELSPHIIKLDTVFTRGIDRNPTRRALTAALLAFARETGAVLVAEGVETAEEVSALKSLGVEYGQGYHLGRPGPLEALAPARSRRSPCVAGQGPRSTIRHRREGVGPAGGE